MKKLLSLLVFSAVVLAMLAGCGGGSSGGTGTSGGGSSGSDQELTTIRISGMSAYASLPIEVLRQNPEWAEELGYNLEFQIYTNGSVINEAMGEWDVAITGAAAVYSLANYGCYLLAHQINGASCLDIWCRLDDPILDCLDDFDAMAECVRGKSLMTDFGTSAHYTAVGWLQQMGLSVNDVTILSAADKTNIWSSWIAGEADYAMILDPYCFYDPAEYDGARVASISSVGLPLNESTIMAPDFYENNPEVAEDMIYLLYQATTALSDPEYALEAYKSFMEYCGKEIDEEAMKLEIEQKPFYTPENASDMDLTCFLPGYAEFLSGIGLIEESKLEQVQNNTSCMQEHFDAAMARFSES